MIAVNFNYNTGHDLTVFMDLDVDAAHENPSNFPEPR